MRGNGRLILAAAFGGYNYIVPDIAQRKAKLHLAIGIHVGGVKIVYAAVISLP